MDLAGIFTFKYLRHSDLGDDLAGNVEKDGDEADEDCDGDDDGRIRSRAPAVELIGPQQASVVHLGHREIQHYNTVRYSAI